MTIILVLAGCEEEERQGSSPPVRAQVEHRAVPTAATSPPVVKHVATADAVALLDLEDKISPTKKPAGQLKGTIINDMGEPCWFKQGATKLESESYFFNGTTGSDTLLLFDHRDCMKTSLGDLGMGIMQRLINDRIADWYSNEDADFQTKPSELHPTSMGQTRGWCMQSATYPLIGVLVEYFVDEGSITAVLHGMALGGCQSS